MTIKTKITLFIAATGFIAGLLFSGVVFFEMTEQPFKVLDTVLREDADRIVKMAFKNRIDLKAAPLKPNLHTLYTHWLEIYEYGTETVLYQSDLAKRVTIAPIAAGSRRTISVDVPVEPIEFEQSDSRKVSFRVRAFLFDLEETKFIVQIARPMEKLKEEIRELAFGIPIGLFFSTLILIVISRFTAGKILQPISAMKNLAQDISEKNLDLRIPTSVERDEFSELARTINGMLDRLQYSFTRQQELLYDTSHELKTPLTTLRLAIDEICAHEEDRLSSTDRQNFYRAKHQVLRMDRLVKNLLNLAALETLNSIDPKPVQITELLTSLVMEYQFLAQAQNITIVADLTQQIVIQGDSERLYRVFSNILDNALKYNEDGGRVKLSVDQSAEGVVITVANTGPGVAEAEQLKVFDQFYRVEKSRSTRLGGSGLGLTIVKKIVELHHGTVRFESKPSEWTRIVVLLPKRSLPEK